MSKLEVRLLGGAEVVLNGRSLSFASRKATALLAYLSLSDEPIPRTTLAALLWPESDETSARNSLRYTLSVLQKELGKGWLDTNRQTIALPKQAGVWVDVLALQTAVLALQTAVLDDNLAGWETAVSLYSGHFMHGFALDAHPFEQWQSSTADYLRIQISQTFEKLLAVSLDPTVTLPYAQRLLVLDNLNEVAYRYLMQGYAAQGNYTEGLRYYEQCVAVLYEELGVDPEPETTAVYQQLLTQREQIPPPHLPQRGRNLIPLPMGGARGGSFVGRERELAQLVKRFENDAQLVTILGSGGMGKTSLAQETAVRLQSDFEHGAAFVPLTAVQSAEGVTAAVATAVQLTFDAGASPQDQLFQYLQDRQMLLVLDNMEHLIKETVLDWVADLLIQATGVKLLVTSRERLRLHSEYLLNLKGLPAEQSAAETLFLQRAERYLDGDADLTAVRQICELVEGIPLALELAAAQAATMSLSDIASTISQNLDLLHSPLHDVLERHRSMRAIYDASWQGLSADLQAVAATLSLFRGGATLAAVQQVAQATPMQLSTLVEKSFLWLRNGRYEMHELLRQYAAEKRADDGSLARHAAYFESISLTENGHELENMLQAWHWLRVHDATRATKMVKPIWQFYRQHNRLTEGITLLQTAVRQLPTATTEQLAEWERLLGMSCIYTGTPQQAIVHLEQSLAVAGYPSPSSSWGLAGNCFIEIGRGIWRNWVGKRPSSFPAPTLLLQTAAKAQTSLTSLHYQLEDTLRCSYSAMHGLKLAQHLGDLPISMLAHANAHGVWRALGLHGLADWYSQQVLDMGAQLENSREYTQALTSLAAWQVGVRPWADLMTLIDDALANAQLIGDTMAMADAVVVRSFLLNFQGRFGDVIENNHTFFRLADKAHNEVYRLWAYSGIGIANLRLGDMAMAKANYAAADALIQAGRGPGTMRAHLAAEKALACRFEGDMEQATSYITNIVEQAVAKMPFSAFFVNNYVGATAVRLTAWEQDRSRENRRLAKQALRRLRLFSQIYPIGKPPYYLYWGMWLAQNKKRRMAHRQWQKGVKWAQKLAMPYEEAQLWDAIAEYTTDTQQQTAQKLLTSLNAININRLP